MKMAKTKKISRGMPLLAIRSSTRIFQSTGKRGFLDGTNTPPTHGHRDLETELAQVADSVKMRRLRKVLQGHVSSSSPLLKSLLYTPPKSLAQFKHVRNPGTRVITI